MTHPDAFDRPVVRALNGFASARPLVTRIMYHLDTEFTFSGVVLMTVVWGCWAASADDRPALLSGTLIAFPAGILSRFLQHHLAGHPRPAYDPVLHFKLPKQLGADIYNTWSGFPSDHAAVFCSLVVTIILVRGRLGLLVAAYLALIESARMFMGAHYPSDLLGGAVLGTAAVWAVQAAPIQARARRLLVFESTSRGLFYGAAFLLSYQIATLFADIRNVVGGFQVLQLVK